MRYLLIAVLLKNIFFQIVWADSLTAHTINVYARFFEVEKPIAGASIYKIHKTESPQLVGVTDDSGRLSFLVYNAEPFTLFIDEDTPGYLSHKRIYSALIEPNKKQYLGQYGEVTFQVPFTPSYYLLKYTMMVRFVASPKENHCHLVTTVTPPYKTLKHCPHGFAGVRVELDPSHEEGKYYFDMFKTWPLTCKTDLFINMIAFSLLKGAYNLTTTLLASIRDQDTVLDGCPAMLSLCATSEDGGVMFLNIPAREKPYTIRSYHPNYEFTQVKFTCRPGSLINISPPQGPKPKLRENFPSGNPDCPAGNMTIMKSTFFPGA